ncbi:hypothetical protein DPMN_035526 [Dreissena polymorpha]|uniref:Uncharacterized protein n=1 Tax=Dreissena polymorpha TaxID=45954 RepID=A0A9D4RKN8_DREPO|nr:hypothetical protein DPMN_035526 [Dreissena polymorpha]
METINKIKRTKLSVNKVISGKMDVSSCPLAAMAQTTTAILALSKCKEGFVEAAMNQVCHFD